MVANGVLDLGIDLDVWPWVWLGLAVLFALVELTFLGGTFVLLPFAVSAFVASILAFYGVADRGAVGHLRARWGAHLLRDVPLGARLPRRSTSCPRGVGADRLVGETGVVTVDIDPDDTDRRGRVPSAARCGARSARTTSASRRDTRARRRRRRHPRGRRADRPSRRQPRTATGRTRRDRHHHHRRHRPRRDRLPRQRREDRAAVPARAGRAARPLQDHARSPAST